MRSMRVVRVGAGLAMAVATVAACFPAYDFSSTGDASEAGVDSGERDATLPPPGADSSSDAPSFGPDSSDSGDARDASNDSTSPVLPTTPVVVLPSTGVATESGNAQQTHLVYATNSARWWLFYIDSDASKVKTRWSADLTTWTEGAQLTLPMGNGGEGRDFSVAYKAFGGNDVVHVVTSLHDDPKFVVYETRATISGETLTWGTPTFVHDIDDVVQWPADGGDAGPQGEGICDPDGSGIVIAPDGHVYIATAWVSVFGCCQCDSNFATSVAIEDGTHWEGGFDPTLQHYSVQGVVNAHVVLTTATGILGGWESADEYPRASTVTWAADDSSGWTATYPPLYVFPDPADAAAPLPQQSVYDWDFCAINPANVQAVRRRFVTLDDGGAGDDSVFEHYAFSGADWTFVSAMPPDVGLAGSGVVLLTNGHGLLAAAIAADGSTLRYATWDTTAWSAWKSLVVDEAGAIQRTYLSGSGCADPAHPVLMWTQGGAPPYSVVALPVGALIP